MQSTSAIGLPIPDSRAALLLKGEAQRWGRVRIEGSFGSANDPRILLGLGNEVEYDAVRVHWPDGSVTKWIGLPDKSYTTLVAAGNEGFGQ